MDVVFESGDIAQGSGCYLIMDNDSGYVSNNLDQESNSDSLPDTLNNSSVEILKSLLPKSVYISEDALLERPDPDQTITAAISEEEYSVWNSGNLSNILVNCTNTETECEPLPKCDSFQSDSGSSINSVVVPVAAPIYYDLNNQISANPPLSNEDENISSNPSDGPFFGFENVPMQGSNRAFRNGLDICTNEFSSTENQINSLFLGFSGNKQNCGNTSEAKKASTTILEPDSSTETHGSSVEKSYDQVVDDSSINIVELPVLSEKPETANSAAFLEDKTISERNQVFGNDFDIGPNEYKSENQLNSLFSVFLGDGQKLAGEEPIPAEKSDILTETFEQSSEQVANDSLINIEELPVFIEGHSVLSEIPNSSIAACMNEKKIGESTPLNLEKVETEEIPNAERSDDKTPNAIDVTGQVTSEKMTESNVLTNVTNTDIYANPEAGPSKIVVPQRRNSAKNKENLGEVFKTPSKCRKRKYSEIGSPDLFSDDESSRAKPPASPKVIEERFVHKLDQRLIKRVQRSISGLPPPPDLTITRLTVDDILEKLEANKGYFWTEENLRQATKDEGEKEKASLNGSHNSSLGCGSSILIEGQLEEAVNKEFPHILYSRHHGLHYNRSKLSEEIEHLCDKYAGRYIGAETQSTCNAVETEYMSPGKRRTAKPKWAVKSPGRRLSHLAKRRITFSSASLQASSSSSAASRARQILIDYKKLELLNRKKSPRKSPRKTPMKSPMASPSNGRTPSSSAKKKLRMRFRLLSGDFKDMGSEPSPGVSSSKRALFQSPDKEVKFRSVLAGPSSSMNSSFERDLANRGTKRSLFSSPNKMACRTSLFPSPNKRSPFKSQRTFEKKRKRDDDDENIANQPKFFRSQSYAEREAKPESSLTRTKSEGVLMNSQTMTDLSAANKKKLQWAVYDSLKDQNITTAHPQFKEFASVLARVTRRCIVSSNIRLEGSGTSEKMLRIARHHVYAVVKGKSLEEIMSEVNRNRVKNAKPQGYVAPQDYNPFPRDSSFSRESALKDRDSNSGDSVTKSASSSAVKPESRIDRIRKVINFEDNR